MHAERPTERFEKEATGHDDERLTAPVWQYSLRSLLIVTTVVSICLAVGVRFAGFMFVVVVVGLSQAAFLLSADWLIRPANRRALAYVTAGSWNVLGSGLLIIGASQMVSVIGADDESATWMFAACLAIAGASCYYIASKRWRGLTRPGGVHRP